jgi:AraC-like DNA-binding protein
MQDDCIILQNQMNDELTGREVEMERDEQRMRAGREELVERIARAMRQDGVIQPLPGLYLARASAASIEPNYTFLKPSLCVIAQGSKEVYLGESRYQYDPLHYLLVTVEVPYISRVLEASKARPYLSFRLELPTALVGSVMAEVGQTPSLRSANVRALDVSTLDANLLDVVVRLARLLDTPDEARVLMPLIMREMIYRLLMGAQGGRLRHLAMHSGHTPDIARAIQQIRQNLDQPLRVEQMARELGMSVSGFHHHFKAVTAMSPLQFQKRLRLQEARRLMMGEDLDAASAAYRVGYNDASHFNREYKSLFGAPPMRDVQRLRESTGALAGQ